MVGEDKRSRLTGECFDVGDDIIQDTLDVVDDGSDLGGGQVLGTKTL